MNDRFKFRAWNKLSNEMKDVISLNINYEFPECSNVILETNTFDDIKTHNNPVTCANGLNNVVLMQCTGLKDKNGKLIYEGDVVKVKEHNLCNNGELYKIIWSESYCQFVGKSLQEGHCIDIIDFNDEEIIGNIYQNKELLDERD